MEDDCGSWAGRVEAARGHQALGSYSQGLDLKAQLYTESRLPWEMFDCFNKRIQSSRTILRPQKALMSTFALHRAC